MKPLLAPGGFGYPVGAVERLMDTGVVTGSGVFIRILNHIVG